MPPWRKDWVDKKLDIARRLANREIGGGYGEAILIISAAISAMAAEVWPGKGIDRKRFIEVIVRHADLNLGLTRISIPLFVSHDRACARSSDISVMVARLDAYDMALVLTGDDIDLTDADVIRQCPLLRPYEIREFSYPSLFYSDVRSGYTHEYGTTERADSQPMTRSVGNSVSYVNVIDMVARIPRRLIYFHVEWLAKIACSIASALDRLGSTVIAPIPSCWWIDER